MIGDNAMGLRRSGSESSLSQAASTKDGFLRRNGSETNIKDVVVRTDVHFDRLPSNSPYVGTFHRGYKASKGGLVQSYDIHPERLSRTCPYIGTFHRGWQAANRESKEIPFRVDCTSPRNEPADHVPSSPAKPPTQAIIDGIDSSHLPKSPELCGLQAILPRQCGVRILHKLGEGSFGKVVLAVNKRNRACWTDRSFMRKLTGMPAEGGSVVLKCVKKDGCYGSKGLLCVAREVEIHSRCCHPNISRMFGYYESGQYVTMILEYIEGKELYDILRSRRQLPESEARVLVLQVLRGVDYLHGKGIVHRDLTPHNMLVKDNGHAFLIDLGLAMDLSSSSPPPPTPPPPGDEKCTGGGSSNGIFAAGGSGNMSAGRFDERPPAGSPSAAGTLGYIPPEAMRNHGVSGITLAVDMWAVGVVLFEAVFGYPPFEPHEVLSDSPVEFPDAIWGPSSEEMRDITAQLLDKNPSRRLTSAGALHHLWFTPESAAAADLLSATIDRTQSTPTEPDTPTAAAAAGGGSGGGLADVYPPPFWLAGGCGSSSSLSSESEPGAGQIMSPLALDDDSPRPPPPEAAGPEESVNLHDGCTGVGGVGGAGGAQHQAASPAAPAADTAVVATCRSEAAAAVAPFALPSAVGKGTGGGGVRECVLRLDSELRGDVPPGGGEGDGNVLYFARILPSAMAN